MTKHTAHAAGTFCWPELYSPDPDRARAFYTSLFGWRVREIPMGPGAAYTVFTMQGSDVAACYGTPPGAQAGGIPARWMPYVSVESADEAAAKVKANGGVSVKEPFDVPGIGRMAALRDPAGAAFCVWQAEGHIGAGVTAEPGALMWTELLTHQTAACERFYRAVFDWGTNLWPMADGSSYHLFVRGDKPVAGMIAITPEMGPVADCWCVYYQVERCDTTFARALELDGAISVPAQDVPGVGRFAVLIDPTGAHFGIMEPARRD